MAFFGFCPLRCNVADEPPDPVLSILLNGSDIPSPDVEVCCEPTGARDDWACGAFCPIFCCAAAKSDRKSAPVAACCCWELRPATPNIFPGVIC